MPVELCYTGPLQLAAATPEPKLHQRSLCDHRVDSGGASSNSSSRTEVMAPWLQDDQLQPAPTNSDTSVVEAVITGSE